MFCQKCGKEIDNDSGLCMECRQIILQNSENIDNVNIDISKEKVIIADEVEQTKSRNKIIALKIAALIGIICFFCPFMLVSCSFNDGKMLEFNGVEFIFGTDKIKDYEREMDEYWGDGEEEAIEDEEEKSIFNWFVCIAGVFAVLELFAIKDIGKGARITTVCLILFRISAKWYYNLEEVEGILNIEYGFALYLAIIIFGVISVATLIRSG